MFLTGLFSCLSYDEDGGDLLSLIQTMFPIKNQALFGKALIQARAYFSRRVLQ